MRLSGISLPVLAAIMLVSLLLTFSYSQIATVHTEVRTTLANAAQASVLISLRQYSLAKASPELRKQEIQALQNSVLANLDREEFQVRYRYQTIPGFSGTLSVGGLLKLEVHPLVESIDPDSPGQGGLLQSVSAISANQVHNLGFTGAGIRVGVLDSGVNLDHRDLSGAIVHQYHFLNQGTNTGSGAIDQHGHGSNVTGIITSDGIQAPKGVAPDAEIVAIKVLDANNRGWVSDWIAGLDYIVAQDTLNVRVINMSLVTDAQYVGDCDDQQRLFGLAVEAAYNAGIIIFASSGNTGSTTGMSAPACLSNAVAVGATYDADLGREPNAGSYQSHFGGSWPPCADVATSLTTLACFTSRNSGLDLVAPGAAITSVGLFSNTSTFRGTSQAAPHAAGVAALLLEKDSSLTPDEILTILKNSSQQVEDAQTGLSFPLLNALEAFDQITSVMTRPDLIPQLFSLEQNFPNPIRKGGTGSTVIRYTLTEPKQVSLSVYNLLGQKISTLVKDFQTAGNHEYILNSRDLPNGVYFYKLSVGPSSEIRKMLVLR